MGDQHNSDYPKYTEMKVVKTVLVEDEGAALRRLEKLASNISSLNIVGTAKSGRDAIQIINNTKPELILLDIELKDMTAFSVLASLKNSFKGQIVFTTAYNQYAIKAFEVAATDYLLKPYDEKRFTQAITRVIDRHDHLNIQKLTETLKHSFLQARTSKFEIIEGAQIHYFYSEDIIWIEAQGYYCLIHKLDTTRVLLRKTLKEMELSLPSESFVRVNRSSIINKNYVEKESRNLMHQFFFLKGGFKVKKSSKYLE